MHLSVHYPWWTLSGTSITRQSGQTGRLPSVGDGRMFGIGAGVAVGEQKLGAMVAIWPVNRFVRGGEVKRQVAELIKFRVKLAVQVWSGSTFSVSLWSPGACLPCSRSRKGRVSYYGFTMPAYVIAAVLFSLAGRFVGPGQRQTGRLLRHLRHGPGGPRMSAFEGCRLR